MIGLVLVGSGCQHPREPIQPSSRTLVINKSQIDIVWDETLDVLREHYFVPDRQDRRAGLIVSYPTVSKQWFEFWRDDAQGCYQVAESSLHNIRRSVEVKFVPAKDRYEIRMTVYIQRKSQPQRQITTSSGAFQIFRDNAPLYISGQSADRNEIVEWVNVGEDVRLANYLLGRLERRLPEG